MKDIFEEHDASCARTPLHPKAAVEARAHPHEGLVKQRLDLSRRATAPSTDKAPAHGRVSAFLLARNAAEEIFVMHLNSSQRVWLGDLCSRSMPASICAVVPTASIQQALRSG